MGSSGTLTLLLAHTLEEYKIKSAKNAICAILSSADITDEERLSAIMGVEY